MGMGIIVILVCAFGFLVYHKFDLRQRQLLAASVNGQAEEQTDLQKAVAGQTESFAGFAGESESVTGQTELLEPDRTDILPAPETPTAMAAHEGERTFGATVPSERGAGFTRDAAFEEPAEEDGDAPFNPADESNHELFAGMGEPVADPAEAFTRTPAPSPEADEDPFAILAANSDARDSTMVAQAEPPAFQRSIDPDLFAGNASEPKPADEFPAFDDSKSVSVADNAFAANNAATTNAFQNAAASPVELLPATPQPLPAVDLFPTNDVRPNAIEGYADTRTDVDSSATAQPIRDLPFADELPLAAPTRSVSQSSPFADVNPTRQASSDMFDSVDVGQPLPFEETSGQPARLPTEPDFASDRIASLVDAASQPPTRVAVNDDLHNVIAMLDPRPDVNLFEDPTDRATRPPQTFPADNLPRIPTVEEPAMPEFPGMNDGFPQRVPEPTLQTFPSGDQRESETFSSPNLFQEPIAPKVITPSPVVEQTSPDSGYRPPEYDPVPQPVDPVPFAPMSDGNPSLRPYEPVLPVPSINPPLTLGPEDGIARMIVPNPVQQTSGTYRHKEICVVREKETYWAISKRIYGTPRYFSSLALYNQSRIPDPKKLRAGMKVLVPEPKVLETKYPELFPADKTAQRRLPTGYFLDKSGQPAYRVGVNETLGAISQKHLGRASRWIQIYQMNRQTLKDPNRLKPGTVINLPDDATNVHLRL